ncbi:hypothetical protein [Thermococcus sp.]|uniref:hypothetical protein n=1 Tax=Thermococcus sp. TaxID=35749 RepID=UPI0025E7D62F|nr:hypothetical protein [Thermococcus sp.]
MAAPVMIAAGAYKNRDLIIKVIAGAAVLYVGYKVYKKVKELGAGAEAVAEGIKDAIEGVKKAVQGAKEGAAEIKKYGWTKPLTSDDTAEIIRKRASKNPNKPYLIPESTYKALKEQGKELPKNVKPYKPDYPSPKEKSVVGSRLGLGHLKPEPKKAEPRNISMEEYKNIQAKRWEAVAKYYRKRAEEEQARKRLKEKVLRPLPIHTPIYAR